MPFIGPFPHVCSGPIKCCQPDCSVCGRPKMLDPSWTPEKGYAHAFDLKVVAERAEARRKEMD